MDINFFKEQIEDEMKNAEEYETQAMAIKSSHPSMSRKLMEMGRAAQKNAECLVQFMEENRKIETRNGNSGTYLNGDYDTTYREVIDSYKNRAPQVNALRDMYNRR